MNTATTKLLSAAATIETPRLLLSVLTPDLWNTFMSEASDEEMVSVLALYAPGTLELEKAKYKSGMTTHFITFRNFLIADKKSGQTIGKGGYHLWQPRHTKAEIGYGIDIASYKRKGLMTEALRAMLQYGFTEIGLYRVEACASPANIPSIRLLESAGFVREGLLRQHYCKEGVLQDSACYSLLKPEYERLKDSWQTLEFIG